MYSKKKCFCGFANKYQDKCGRKKKDLFRISQKEFCSNIYGPDSKADQFEIWIDSQYPFSDTDHNQASSVNSFVWVSGLTFKIRSKSIFFKSWSISWNKDAPKKLLCESFYIWGFWSHSKANDLCHLYVWLAVFDS